MKHRLWPAFLGVLLLTPWAATSPAQPRKKLDLVVGPSSAHYSVFMCNANERTLAIASGAKGDAPLGIYVFDPHGNCVARDEVLGWTRSVDDVAIEWFPPANLFYTVELRNQGFWAADVELVIR